MDLPSILFYVFSGLLIISAISVISNRNPVYAVLSLIFAFFNAAALFVLLGAEYLAMTLVIVYVGAVAILFLFVVMMMNINFAELRAGFTRYLPIGVAMSITMLAMLYALSSAGMVLYPTKAHVQVPTPDDISNAKAIGGVLYTRFFYPFQIAGAILLVAMIGAIVLTLRSRSGVLRQKVAKQLARKRSDSVALVDVETGRGV